MKARKGFQVTVFDPTNVPIETGSVATAGDWSAYFVAAERLGRGALVRGEGRADAVRPGEGEGNRVGPRVPRVV